MTNVVVAFHKFANAPKTVLSTANVFKSASLPGATDVPCQYFIRLETKPQSFSPVSFTPVTGNVHRFVVFLLTNGRINR
jgi:hypothetical protein